MKKNKSRYAIFFVIILIGLTFMPIIPVVYATEELMTSYAFGNRTTAGYLKAVHPSADSLLSAIGIAANATTGGYLTKFTVDLMIDDEATVFPYGDLVAKVYAGSGTYGTNMTPTGSALTTSSPLFFNEDTIANVPSHDTYNFTFDGTYYLVAGTQYCFVVEMQSAVGLAGAAMVYVGHDATSSSYGGNRITFSSSIWVGTAQNDIVFEIYVSSQFGGEGAEDPFDPGTWTDPSDVITAVTSFLVPLTVVLIPVFLLTFLGGRTKWMVLIGLVIGIGLGFYFGFVPLWLVFLITIGIIGMAYQSVRSGGDS